MKQKQGAKALATVRVYLVWAFVSCGAAFALCLRGKANLRSKK
jgi:hypothetical protein